MPNDSSVKKSTPHLSGEGSVNSNTGTTLRELSQFVDAGRPTDGDTTLKQTGGVSLHPPRKDEGPKQQPVQSKAGRNVARRSVKIALASIVALAGMYAVLVQQRVVTSDEAIVSAYVSAVRTPIEGNVSGIALKVGSRVGQGAVLGHVENPRAYDQALENLSLRQEEDRGAMGALGGQISELLQQRSELESRAHAHKTAVCVRLERLLSQAAALLDAKRVAAEHAGVELERSRNLRDAGAVTEADFERRQSESKIAKSEQAAAEAEIAGLQAELDAAGKGTLAEPGVSADVPYSQQRIDEISLRLAELHATRANLAFRADHIAADVTRQIRHSELMRSSAIIAPVTGTVWRLQSNDGEHIATGDTLAEIVDSSHPFLLISIPQDRVPDIQLGAKVKFKLSGETEQRTGTVISIAGITGDDENRRFAAIPLPNSTKRMAAVRVQFDDLQSSDRLVGRTARAVISANGRNRLSQSLASFF
jgi:multidrug resistance efflux pump